MKCRIKKIAIVSPGDVMRKIVATGKHLDQCICHRFTLSFEALQEALDDSLKGLISVVKLALE